MLRNSKITSHHFFFYSLVLTILLAILFAVSIRLALPKINIYKNEIESIISDYMGYSVDIDTINAEWKGWTPNLYLENIKLLSERNNSEIIQFHSARIGINLVESISKGVVTPSYIQISGLNLNVYRNKDGAISIKNDNSLNTNVNNQPGLTEWLFTQKYLILKNVNLVWNDENINIGRKEFNNISLELKKDEKNTQIELNTALSQQEKQLFKINANITGDILTSTWQGDINLELINIDPTRLTNKLYIFSAGGLSNAKISTKWENAKLINFNGVLEYSNFSSITEESLLLVKNINFNLNGSRKLNKDWSLNLILHNFETKNGEWPASNYQFEFIKDSSNDNYLYKGYLTFLRLEDILPFIITTNILPNNIFHKLDLESISGDINNLNIEIDHINEESIKIKELNANFDKLSIISHDQSSSISGLKGVLAANNNYINVNIDSDFTKVKFDKLYTDEKIFSKLTGELELNYDKLLINNLKIIFDGISLTSNGNILINENPPHIDLNLTLDESNIEYFSTLIPDKTNPELYKWLNNSLLGGKILSADMAYQGYAKNFLLNNSKSNFKAIFNVSDVNLDYNKNWPPIDNLTAEIIIENDDLLANISSGYIFNAEISNTTAKIKHISGNSHNVIINTQIYSHMNDLKNFIAQSPLNENPALIKYTNNIIGNIDINLNLDIPLGLEKTKFNGKISLNSSSIESGLPGLALENVNGDINFSVNEIWANDIDAIYIGNPIKLTIPTTNYKNLDFLPFEISGVANKKFIIDQMTGLFPNLYNNIENIRTYLSGESEWTFSLSESENNSQIDDKKIEFKSDLYGIGINLPPPLGKEKNELRPLIIKTNISNLLIDKVSIYYNNEIFTDIFIDNTKDFFVKNINIGLEKKHPENKTDNSISIQGSMNNLIFTDWANFINTSKTNNEVNQDKTFLGKINVKNLEIINKNFNNVNINFASSNSNKDWNIVFDSEKIKGEARYKKKSIDKNDYLYLNFETISLSENQNTENLTAYKIHNMPELDISINNFIYKNNELGHLNLKTTNSDNIINIDKLSFKKAGVNINGNGFWSSIDEIDKSEFYVKLESDSIKKMFDTFNYTATNIKDAKTLLEFNINWDDSPLNFAMENLNGQINMNIEKGRFLDIEPKAGRLFGLLSIQALPRRLSLDFADLFNEGFAFDTIKGNFNLEGGQAYTNNLQMVGPSGDIMISGRTGLVAEDYDQIATVIPKVSDSLPLASALFGPVGVGVGAVLYFAGELFESIPENIDKILTQQYSIKGSWENPDIEKINTNK